MPPGSGRRQRKGSGKGFDKGSGKASGKGSGKGKVSGEQAEIAELETAIAAGVDGKAFRKFAEFPLSRRTQAGLLAAGFVTPTDIQKEALARCLEVHISRVCVGWRQ